MCFWLCSHHHFFISPSNRDMTRIGISSAAHQDKILSSAQGMLSQMQQIQDRMVPVWSETLTTYFFPPSCFCFVALLDRKKTFFLPHPHLRTLKKNKKKRIEDKKKRQKKQGRTANGTFFSPFVQRIPSHLRCCETTFIFCYTMELRGHALFCFFLFPLPCFIRMYVNVNT